MPSDPSSDPNANTRKLPEQHLLGGTMYPQHHATYCDGDMKMDGDAMYLSEATMYPKKDDLSSVRGTMYQQSENTPPTTESMYPRGDSMYPVRPLGKRLSSAVTSSNTYWRKSRDLDSSWPLDRPLTVAHINAALIPAGIEYWLASLRRYADPSRLRFTRTVVLSDWVDRRQISRMGMAIEVGGRQSVMNAASQCDVLLISDPGSRSAEVCQWILDAKPPVTVFVAHGDGDYTRDRLSGIGPAVDHIVAVTEHVHREVCEGWPVSMILNGVDPHRLVKTQPRQVSRQQLGFANGDFVVGFVGRFSEEKNPQLVVEAVSQLPHRYKALMIGHGYMRSELIEQCLELLPGRFVLMEGDGDLGDLYASMDALVMPSRLEGYGLVAMEAMMCGVPVIGTPFGMVADLVTDHINAVVVQPTADAIANAAFKLGEHRNFRQSIIAGGKLLANQTGYASQMARQYEQLLSKLWLEALGHSDADR